MVRSKGISRASKCVQMSSKTCLRIAKCPATGGGCFCGLPLQYEGPLGSVECVDVRGMGVDHIAWGNNWR